MENGLFFVLDLYKLIRFHVSLYITKIHLIGFFVSAQDRLLLP